MYPEQIKSKERAEKGNGKQSILDGIPKLMPALAAAQSMRTRVARTGILPDLKKDPLTQISSVFSDLKDCSDQTAKEKAVGKAFFLLLNKAIDLEVDAESALRVVNEEFRSHIRDLEGLA